MKVSFADIQDILSKTDFSGKRQIKISILRNITVEQIEPYLKYEAYKADCSVELKFGAFDNIIQEVYPLPSSLINTETDAIIIFMKLESVAPKITGSFNSLTIDEIETEIGRVTDLAEKIISSIRKVTNGMILWQGFEMPVYPSMGAHDRKSENGQSAASEKLNSNILKIARKTQNTFWVDLSLCLMRIGYENYYDNKFWHMAKAPYSLTALEQIAYENYRYIRALTGKNKKCIVLDCDNILWGGIIGEDGINRIKLGTSSPGSYYKEFQQEIVNFYSKGIIIALCSKNNEADVWEVFDKHPDMLIKKEHIAAYRINWNDKAENLREIASDLNIGLDSIVFVDDSDFEINLVKKELPEVERIHLIPSKAFLYKDTLKSCALFDALTITEEDKQRGCMYRAEAKRKELSQQVTDLSSYYKSLEMVLKISLCDDLSVSRVAQLTQKTNQFNLTTKRYSDADINTFIHSEDHDVLYVKLGDRFGDMGIIGVCILNYSRDEVAFDTFLFSCRALGRNIEKAFLFYALKLAKEHGKHTAVGKYVPTKKNAMVMSFYNDNGFIPVSGEGDGLINIFKCDLRNELPAFPNDFKSVELNLNFKE